VKKTIATLAASAIAATSYVALRPASIVNPPPAPGYILHFVWTNNFPLTNGMVESSTDLVHWEDDWDAMPTNGVDWWVPNNKPCEFFRAKGQPL
jgi:hypothetical protein